MLLGRDGEHFVRCVARGRGSEEPRPGRGAAAEGEADGGRHERDGRLQQRERRAQARAAQSAKKLKNII